MPKLIEIPPSNESKQKQFKPITVVNRTIAANCVVQRHSHSWGQFIYANSGVLSVVTDNHRYIIPPEQGVWVVPNISHQVSAITNSELTSFYVGVNCMENLAKDCCVLSVDGFLKSLILESKKTNKEYDWQDADGLLLRLIIEKLSKAPKVLLQLPYPKDKRLLTMLSMLQQHDYNHYDLAQWGKIVGASSRTLSRLFKVETGMTFSQWRQRLKVQLAITKMGQGHSIANIAAELGYESPSAFSYMFKENTGVSPSVYRDK